MEFETIMKAIVALSAVALAPLTVFALFRLVRVYLGRIEGRPGAEGAILGEVDDLRQRVEELRQLRDRVAELEERLDFAERLLAQQRAAGQLKAGGPE